MITEITNTDGALPGNEFRCAKRFEISLKNDLGYIFETMELSFISSSRNNTAFYIIVDGKSIYFKDDYTYAARDKRWIHWWNNFVSTSEFFEINRMVNELNEELQKHFERATGFCEMFYGYNAINSNQHLTQNQIDVEYAIIIKIKD